MILFPYLFEAFFGFFELRAALFYEFSWCFRDITPVIKPAFKLFDSSGFVFGLNF